MLKVILLLSLSLTSCFQLFEVGPNTIIKESYNPNASKKAILLLKGSNTTSNNLFQVIVSGYDYELKDKDVGNTFTVDSDHNKEVGDSSSINFNWLSNDTLEINHDKKLRISLQERSVDGVSIIYK